MPENTKRTLPALTLSLLAAGATLAGLVAAGAQDTPPPCADETPVLMVVAGNTLDGARMGAYAGAIQASGLYPALQGYYLNAPRPIAVFEGEVDPRYVTLIVRFPSLCAAEAFWRSETYQNEILPLRQNPPAGDYTVTVYKEADLPAYLTEAAKVPGWTAQDSGDADAAAPD